MQQPKLDIKVTHIGDDYGKVAVMHPEGGTSEYEIDKTLALLLNDYIKAMQQTLSAHIEALQEWAQSGR